MALSAMFGDVSEEATTGYGKLKSEGSDIGNDGARHLKAKG